MPLHSITGAARPFALAALSLAIAGAFALPQAAKIGRAHV